MSTARIFSKSASVLSEERALYSAAATLKARMWSADEVFRPLLGGAIFFLSGKKKAEVKRERWFLLAWEILKRVYRWSYTREKYNIRLRWTDIRHAIIDKTVLVAWHSQVVNFFKSDCVHCQILPTFRSCVQLCIAFAFNRNMFFQEKRQYRAFLNLHMHMMTFWRFILWRKCSDKTSH